MISFRDAGYGYDVFGLHPLWVERWSRWLAPVYDNYFRVRSYGTENIPTDGAAVMASNHSGTLPLDGTMIYLNVLRQANRVVRPVADHFVPQLPFIGTMYARLGVVGGSRGNVRRLLEYGELLLIFPEGVPGISKPFSKRYQLQKWRVGHVELAIRHGAPVVPVAVIGAEEQMPQLGSLPLRFFGAPHLPLTLTPVPLPVRYHIYYGEPIPVHKAYSPEQADDPEVLERCAQRVKEAVDQLIQRGLSERRGFSVERTHK